jgi:hypothetical protein
MDQRRDVPALLAQDLRHAVSLFAVAFALLGLSWALLSIFNPVADGSPYVYGLRLIAFLVIIAAVVQKNREAAR